MADLENFFLRMQFAVSLIIIIIIIFLMASWLGLFVNRCFLRCSAHNRFRSKPEFAFECDRHFIIIKNSFSTFADSTVSIRITALNCAFSLLRKSFNSSKKVFLNLIFVRIGPDNSKGQK